MLPICYQPVLRTPAGVEELDRILPTQGRHQVPPAGTAPPFASDTCHHPPVVTCASDQLAGDQRFPGPLRVPSLGLSSLLEQHRELRESYLLHPGFVVKDVSWGKPDGRHAQEEVWGGTVCFRVSPSSPAI